MAVARRACSVMMVEKRQRKTTLLDLLYELQAEGPHSEQALVSIVLKLVNSGRVVLRGTYAGSRVRLS